MERKIIHLIPSFELGGGPRVVYNIAKNIQSCKHIVVGKYDDINKFHKEFQKEQIKTYNLNLRSLSYKNILKLLTILKKEKVDLIHSHGKAGFLYAYVIKNIFKNKENKKLKFVHSFHGFSLFNILSYEYLLKNLLYYSILLIGRDKIDRYIVLSESEKSTILKYLNLNKEQVILIPNFAEVKKEKPPAIIEHSLGEFEFNLVAVARINKQKDLKTLIKSYKLFVNKVNKKISLHLFYTRDDNKYLHEIKKLIKKEGLSNSILLWENVPNVKNFLYKFDIFVSTSRFEGLPLTILEAFLNKIPVVATACNGNKDLIKDLETGFLAEVGNPYSICLKLLECYTFVNYKKKEIEEILNSAFNLALKKFSKERFIKDYENLYNELLN